jgi:phosphosulfolactate synthase (CoM biosynthesis protein A)
LSIALRPGERATEVRTKEGADHSLPYLLAVCLLDGQVLPAQFAPERGDRHGGALRPPGPGTSRLMDERAFSFLRLNEREPKPRRRGVAEIRGPYYTALGKRQLEDALETMSACIDTLKYAGGSFTLMPRTVVHEPNELCHRYRVEVSTGGFLEYVLTQGGDAVDRYLTECAELGFDIVEVSSGFVTLPAADLVALTQRVQQAGLQAKPEVGIQFGAGGASSIEALEAQGQRDVGQAIELAKRHLDGRTGNSSPS